MHLDFHHVGQIAEEDEAKVIGIFKKAFDDARQVVTDIVGNISSVYHGAGTADEVAATAAAAPAATPSTEGNATTQ